MATLATDDRRRKYGRDAGATERKISRMIAEEDKEEESKASMEPMWCTDSSFDPLNVPGDTEWRIGPKPSPSSLDILYFHEQFMLDGR
jgi:hypothetical protein